MKHRRVYVPCRTEVVYEFPLTCGMVYVGQTRRCIIKRLMEHSNSLGDGSGKHLPVHCSTCAKKCKPIFSSTKGLGRAKGQRAREILEASWIIRHGPDKCVSDTSVKLLSASAIHLCISLGMSLISLPR